VLFNTPLTRNIEAFGEPTKKERLEANTPLRHFLRPILEELMRKKAEAAQQQQMQQQMPTRNPLQGALQQGGVNDRLQQAAPINQGY